MDAAGDGTATGTTKNVFGIQATPGGPRAGNIADRTHAKVRNSALEGLAADSGRITNRLRQQTVRNGT
jgi:hypothetical protein